MNKIFHFSLGPVQGFVAQARRTRDLWAGSFLLSWLSAQAMKAVINQKGSIIFPRVTTDQNIIDPMLQAVMGVANAPKPQIGSIPNRFKAEVPRDFDPKVVENAINTKWLELAEAVYETFVKNFENKGNGTRTIWDRQVSNFWEINWVLGDKPTRQGDDDQWLDIRKNWRNHWPEPEGGDHCTMMGDFQELSGYNRSRVSDKEKQNGFWQLIRKPPRMDAHLDIRDNERLCAIALIKRAFPRLSENKLKHIIGWVPGGKAENIKNWPSTTYMAIAPWLAKINKEPDHIEALETYILAIKNKVLPKDFSILMAEKATHLAVLENINNTPFENWHLSDIHGDLLHQHALSNYRNTYLSSEPLTFDGKDNDAELREKLLKALTNLYKKVDSIPRSYYALLLMDGDSLGKMLREKDPVKVSDALLKFTQTVQPCVDNDDRHGGMTIYAGGDDVFALLPMHTAISCAKELRRLYGDCFSEAGFSATASCAIVFAHHQVPLRNVIREAHHQLDDIAKDTNGRDSLSLAVYKPGGVTAQWVTAWQNGLSPVDAMQTLIGALMKGDYPRGFFHKLRDRYGFFNDESPTNMDVKKLLIAEYMSSRDRQVSLEQAEDAVTRLMSVCQPLSRDKQGKTSQSETLKLEAGLIARFLTQEED